MPAKPSALIDTRVIYCGEQYDAAPSFDQLRKLPNECIDLIYMDPPFNSNRNYEAFWGETKVSIVSFDPFYTFKPQIQSVATAGVVSRRNPSDVMFAVLGFVVLIGNGCDN